MLSVISRRNGVRAAGLLGSSCRGMATLKETSNRLKSVSSISKITKSMKMIASTKVNKAQAIMETARAYANVTSGLISKAEITPSEKPQKRLYVVISSDRGLCGSIHSGLTKNVKEDIHVVPDTNIIVLGQKSRSQISRFAADKFVASFDEVAKTQPTWFEAAIIAQEILKLAEGYDVITIVYNRFKSVISYNVSHWVIPTLKEDLSEYTKLNLYDYEKEDIETYREFAFANILFSAIAEGYASEMSAKRTAMENATKNADEMIEKLTLSYNRSRQASITNELIDIITGASAM